MRNKISLSWLFYVCAALVLVGCGDDGSTSPTDTRADSTTDADVASDTGADAQDTSDTQVAPDTNVPDSTDTSDGALTFDEAAYAAADARRGGQLYDAWWAIIEQPVPTKNHPLWPVNIQASPRDTWRCHSCHGWDYKGVNGAYAQGPHFTGIKGLLGTSRPPREIFELLSSDSHAYTMLAPADVLDLTKFVAEDLIDMDPYIDPLTGAPKGDVARGETYYTTTESCSSCHGSQGFGVNFDWFDPYGAEYLPDVAEVLPWRVLHQLRVGRSITDPPMPNVEDLGWDLQAAADIIAYARTLRVQEFVGRDLMRGGQLYDRWWDVRSGLPPSSYHPLFDQSIPVEFIYDSWKCSTCHGFDYKGTDGAFEAAKALNAPNLMTSEMTAAEMVALLSSTDTAAGGHSYTQMTNDDLWFVVFFVKAGLIDGDEYVDPVTKIGLGDPDLGAVSFQDPSACRLCHGTDGLARNVSKDPYGQRFLPDIAHDSPWRALHDMRFGQPGSRPSMLSARDLDFTYKNLKDVLAYAQTLYVPELTQASITRGGALYDTYWKVDATYPEPTTTHPLYGALGTQTGGTTWRCVECHGWDYKGVEGEFASGPHYTGIAGVRFTSLSVSDVVEMLEYPASGHSYDFMSTSDLWSLALFIKFGPKAEDNILFPNGVFIGDWQRGQTAFEAPNSCASCHGTDGMYLDCADGGSPEYVGTIANSDPWRYLHRTRYGEAGANMPNAQEAATSVQDLADLGTWSALLPQQ